MIGFAIQANKNAPPVNSAVPVQQADGAVATEAPAAAAAAPPAAKQGRPNLSFGCRSLDSDKL